VITKSWGIKCDLFNTSIRETKEYKTDILKELAINENDSYILSPRLIGPVYNHEIILEAFTLISQKYPKYKLIMMHYNLKNTDEYWKELRDYSNQLGIANKIIWTERYLTSEEMADIYAKAEVMINIPKYDQLASTVLEGISSGCFAIVSDLKPYYEVVKDGFNGFILADNTPESILEAFDKYKKEQNQFEQNALAYAKEIQEQYKEEYFIDHIRREIKSLVSKYTNSN
jgi:glycosyltransferase involved in cell wall biosynthesis